MSMQTFTVVTTDFH